MYKNICKLKVLILIPGFPPATIGGTENQTLDMARTLSNNGHEVHIITRDKINADIYNNEKFFVHSVEFCNFRYIKIILFWFRVILLMKKIRPDIIHAQNLYIGIGGLLGKLFFDINYLVYGRGTDVYLSSIFERKILEVILNHASLIIAQTKNMKKEIGKFCHKNEIIVLPNGIDLDKFKSKSKSIVRKKLEFYENDNIILFVGRLHPIKGIEYLIKSIKILNNSINLKLIIIGDGSERNFLKNLVDKLDLSNEITFLGKKSQHEIMDYMNLSDILVLPSLYEGFPNVILESMASSLPVIATDVGGVAEIINDGENGFLVKPKNPNEIAEKILLLINNKKLYNSIAFNNLKKIKQYSWNNISLDIEEIYKKMINK